MLEYNLCMTFGGYTPDILDKMPYIDVIEIYAETRRIQIDEKKRRDREKELEEKGIKYVPATTNDW